MRENRRRSARRAHPVPAMSITSSVPVVKRIALSLLATGALSAVEAAPDLITAEEWQRSESRPGQTTAPSAAGGLASIGGSLVLVVILVIGLGFLVKRLGVRRLLPSKGRHLELLDTLPIAYKRQVALVRLGDQAVLIGLGEHDLHALGSVPLAKLSAEMAVAEPEPVVTSATPPPAPPSDPAFARTLQRMLGRAP
jgi:flagellar protein FliO/FliZ